MVDKLVTTFFGSIAIGLVIGLAGAGIGVPVLMVAGIGFAIIAALAFLTTIIIDVWRQI